VTSNGCRIRVLVADDAPMRAGVRLALEAAGMAICAEADDASAAVKAAVRERPDVCLVETRIPGDGIAAAADCRCPITFRSISRAESGRSWTSCAKACPRRR
jgi:DNA-binding NarL/FixJ family response regulator